MVGAAKELSLGRVLVVHEVGPGLNDLRPGILQLGIQPATEDAFCRSQLNKLRLVGKVLL